MGTHPILSMGIGGDQELCTKCFSSMTCSETICTQHPQAETSPSSTTSPEMPLKYFICLLSLFPVAIVTPHSRHKSSFCATG